MATGGIETGVRRHLTVIKRVTGHQPSTCPWRAWYHPLVREVMSIAPLVESGNLAAGLGDDPPHLLYEAVMRFEGAVAATRADDRALERQEREAERARRQAQEGSRR